MVAKHVVAKCGGKVLHELSAVMPPFEMVELLLVRAVSKMTSVMLSPRSVNSKDAAPRSSGVVRKVMFIDVSKAHLYALVNADVDAFVDVPPEFCKQDICGRLNS